MNVLVRRIQVCHSDRPLTDASVSASALETLLDAFAPCLLVCFVFVGWRGSHQGGSFASCWIFAPVVVRWVVPISACAGRLTRIVSIVVFTPQLYRVD